MAPDLEASTEPLLACPFGPLELAAVPPPGPAVRLSLVVPTYNESEALPELVAELEALFDPVLGEAYELIVVDDDSPDRTWEVAARLAATRPHLRVVRRTREKGLASAVVRGWQLARGEILGVMDADLQHPVETNLALVRELLAGADLAVASRHVAGGGVSDWRLSRRLVSRGAQLLGLLVLPEVLGRLSDPMSGFFMVRRSALSHVVLDPLGYKILIEVVARGRIGSIREVGYVFRERAAGSSKATLGVYAQYCRHLLRLRWAAIRRRAANRGVVEGG